MQQVIQDLLLIGRILVTSMTEGAFDAVTRATANHGLASEAVSSVVQLLKISNGNKYELAYWNADGKAVMSDGSVYTRSTNEDKKASVYCSRTEAHLSRLIIK